MIIWFSHAIWMQKSGLSCVENAPNLVFDQYCLRGKCYLWSVVSRCQAVRRAVCMHAVTADATCVNAKG